MLLCIIIDNGENFKFGSGFCFMQPHFTMVANPFADFSRESTWIFAISLSSNVDEWGTLVNAASI